MCVCVSVSKTCICEARTFAMTASYVLHVPPEGFEGLLCVYVYQIPIHVYVLFCVCVLECVSYLLHVPPEGFEGL